MRPCLKAGCPELTEATYCERHSPAERPQAVAAYSQSYDSRWRKLRQMHIARQPLCVHCEERGQITPAQEVDHIIPWRGSQTLLRAGWNLQSLCRSCHHTKTRADETWAALRFPAPPQNNDGGLTVIWGAPASGKSTYAASLGCPVIDLDEIYRELGASERMITIELTIAAMEIRNERIRRPGPRAMVATLPRLHERLFWSEVWGATLVQRDAPLPVLRERINARGPARRASSLEALDRWLRVYEGSDE